MRARHIEAWLAAVLALLLAQGDLFAAPILSIGSTAGVPGATVQVPISIATDTNVASLQFDLVYSTNYLQSGTPTGGNALADHLVASSEPSAGLRRVLIFSLTSSPLTNGVLAFVPMTIATNAAEHSEALSLTNVVLVNANADEIPATPATGGTLTIATRPRFISIVRTNGGVARLTLSGTTGSTYVLQTTTNLALPQWSGVQTGATVAGRVDFVDLSAGSVPIRLYRAQWLQ